MVRVPNLHQLFYQYYLISTYLFESCLPMVFSNPTSPESLDLFGINCVQIGIPYHFLLIGFFKTF